MRVLVFIAKFASLGNRQICMNRYINPKTNNLTQNRFLSNPITNIAFVKQDHPPREVIICERNIMV